MPELPEVETIRRGLAGVATGATVTRVSATGARSVRRHGDPASFGAGLAGRPVSEVVRTGKFLGLVLAGGPGRDEALVFHLGMSGQLLWVDDRRPAPPHTHLTVELDGDRRIRFVDPRTFGEVFVAWVGPTGWPPPELAHLGFDPLSAPPSPAAFAGMLATRRTRLKPLLMDQRFVAGIGNIYSDEILHAARLGPDRPACDLAPAEARRLRRAMLEVLTWGIELGGSSLADAQYRDIHGRPGRAQERHRVHARAGRPCPRCRAEVVRVRWAGRSSYRCPACQV